MIITFDAHDDDDAPALCPAQPPKHVCLSFQGTRGPHPHLVAMAFDIVITTSSTVLLY